MNPLRLTRRELLAVTTGCALGTRLTAAELPGFYYRQYSRCLPDHLTTLAQAAYQKRNRDLAALTTPAAIAKRQKWVSWDVLETRRRRARAHAAQRAGNRKV